MKNKVPARLALSERSMSKKNTHEIRLNDYLFEMPQTVKGREGTNDGVVAKLYKNGETDRSWQKVSIF